ncbi:MAG: hypothetical protein GYB36_02520 [Alphaproteobacteria bacterium]|nr:hypothetical protein [Alphaproteobacteria bacterium]
MKKSSLMLAALSAGALVAGCATTEAANHAVMPVVERSQAEFERDRQAILAMQGEYAVTFDFIETIAIEPGYELAEDKSTPAREVVIVVEDTGDFIMLQHLLIVGEDDSPFIVKHWRQDWRYEPDTVLAFQGHDDWMIEAVDETERTGAWSQTVYQVDDSPRYAAVAQWDHGVNASTWEPPVSWRPLPRRDDTTRDDYDAIAAVNRHTITNWGWVHDQDNSKLALRDGQQREIVREIGTNTYVRTDLPNDQAAHDYWAATEAYWALVRGYFMDLEAQPAGTRFHIEDDADGTLLYGPVLEAGQRILFGMSDTQTAWDEAQVFLNSQILIEE